MDTPRNEVTEHELLVRINQKLARRGQVMRSNGPAAPGRDGFAEYHLIDINTNQPEQEHCDLVWWGYELGVLTDGEVPVAGR